MKRRGRRPKVVLVKPPERSHFNFGTFSLAVLAAAVRDIAQVRLIDATTLGPDEAAARVWAQAPAIIGVTTMGLGSVPPVANFIAVLRAHPQMNPATRIIAGGHGASMLPERLLEAGADAVVIGEGERTFRQLIERGFAPGDPGLACLVGERVVRGPAAPLLEPLDTLPLPARDLMPRRADSMHLMETSRGCPHACAFCETVRFHGRRWRHHSPERVAREVRDLVTQRDAWIIHVTDDNFAASRRRAVKICELLSRQQLPACFMVSARADDLLGHDSLLPALAAARFLRISVGVETLEGELAHVTGKSLSLTQYRELFQRMRSLGIFSVASFIIGLPGETIEMRRRAGELALAAGPDSARFLPYYPLPGTPLASWRVGLDPDPADVAHAEACNLAFLAAGSTRRRLAEAAAGGGVRALLARGVLSRGSDYGETCLA
jgi:anaerobic magnesium-protoporphyrin IX monomethyl ester cyclase